MKTVTEQMTPKKAAAHIEQLDAAIASGQVKQRLRSEMWIRALTNLILLGRWKLIPDGIAFDTSGHLINGQQRLCAIAKSGMTVPIRVTYGADPDSILAIDRGRIRGVGAQLGILGYENGNLIAAMANGVAAVVLGPRSFTAMEAGQVMEIHALYERVFDEILACSLNGAQRERRAPYLAPMILCAAAQPVETFEFVQKYVSGEGLLKGDPALALRVWDRNHTKMGRGRENRITCSRVVCSALRHHIEGNKIASITASEEARQWLLKQNKTIARKIEAIVSPPKVVEIQQKQEPLKLAA